MVQVTLMMPISGVRTCIKDPEKTCPILPRRSTQQLQTAHNKDTRQEEMDRPLPLATTETLRPLVQLFVDKLTTVQWGELESGSLDKVTEDTITQLCIDIVNAISQYIYETFKQSLQEGSDLPLKQSPPTSLRNSSGSDGSRKNILISEKQVHECLGDTISHTFVEVMGVQEDIRCQSTNKVTELVVKEVTERVNSEFSKSSGTSRSSEGGSEGRELLVSKSFTCRLMTMVKHVVKILRKCMGKMTCMFISCDDKKGQTPITTVEEDGPEKVPSGESVVLTAPEAVKKILEEEADNICASECDDEIPHELHNLLVSSSSQDTDKVASEIVRFIMEELKLETDGTPKKESVSATKSSKATIWKSVGTKIKAYFVHKFAKESILSSVAKLRSKLERFIPIKETGSLKLLIERVDSLVEDMIPPEEDQQISKGTKELCLYLRIAISISSGKLKMISNQLSNEVFYYLELDNLSRQRFRVKIQTEVDKFMTLMSNWLNQQAQQHERKMDPVSAALRRIERVVSSLPALTEVQDKEHIETAESGQSPITTVEEDGPEKVSSGESVVVTATEAVKKILEEQGNKICVFDCEDDFSQEELDLLVSSSSKDTDTAASRIVSVLMDDVKLETDGTPKEESVSEAECSKTSCWNMVRRNIKAYLVHKFAKESILSFVAKLRSKPDCFSSIKEKASLKLLIEKVDSLVKDMIPPQKDQQIRKGTDEVCLYQIMARDISSGELEIIAKQLSSEVFHYLNLDNKLPLYFLIETQNQVHMFMKLMWNWLNKQANQQNRKRDLVNVALRRIERVVSSLPALTEVQDEEHVETVESGQSSITTVEEDGPENVKPGESVVVTATEAVKMILEEQGNKICVFECDDDFSQEELDLLASSSSKDTDTAASRIVSVLMEDVKLQTDGTPKEESVSEAKSSKTSCWNMVRSNIKAYLVHKFAKESILSFVAKLRSKPDCFSSIKDKASLKLLIEKVDKLVKDMIPPQEDQQIRKGTDEVCLYQIMARDISSGELEMIAKQLCREVFHYLNLDNECPMDFMFEIQNQVDMFMKLMCNWLNKQANQQNRKRDLVNVALRRIERVVSSLPALTEVQDEEHVQTVESGQSSITTVEEDGPENVSSGESFAATKSMPKLLEQRRNKIRGVLESVPALTKGPLVLKRDAFVFEAAPKSIANEPAISDEAACEITAHPVQDSDKLCVFLVLGLVNQIMKGVSLNLSSNDIKPIVLRLKEMLLAEIIESDIDVKPSSHHMKRTVKAVHKVLCTKMGNAGKLQMKLLSQDALIYKYIIETLKKHLVTPKKRSSVNTNLFSRL